MAIQIQLRRDDLSSWGSVNPTLADGEIGIVIGSGRFKIGDGVTDWNGLSYFDTVCSGVSDHGELSGLLDDDHPQYLKEFEFTTYSGTLQSQIDSKSDSSHTHDDRYYTEFESDGLFTTLSGSLQSEIDSKSDLGHTHDDRYYTEFEVDYLITSVSGCLDDKKELAGINWTARSAAEANLWQSVTYGNGLFVAVAATGTNRVMTSTDGINWTACSAAESNAWYSVTYGNGLFVAVAGSGTNRVMTSPDGINWTAHSVSVISEWHSVTYGNGLFVAVASYGTKRVMTSKDGINWIPRNASEASEWYSVTCGNGVFVAVAIGGTNRIMRSVDGISWTSYTSTESNAWYSVTYGNGLFVAVAGFGTSNRVITSSDGINWEAHSAAEENTWRSVTYGNGLFVAVAGSGTNRVMTSPDGINWTARSPVEANTWCSVTYGNSTFVAISWEGSNRVITSGKIDRTIIPYNNTYQGGMILYGELTISGTASGDIPVFDDDFTTKQYVDNAIATISGGSGTTDHSSLNNLDYSSSGHTGFQPAGDYLTDLEFTTYSGTLQSQIDSKSDSSHTHDDRYYTESEVDSLLATISGGTTDHGLLDGLNDDDHTQYLMSDGSRQLTGDWDFGSNTISGTGDVCCNDVYTEGNVYIGDSSLTSSGTGISVGGHGPGMSDELVNVCYGTGDPPDASTVAEGALWIKYTV